MSCPADVPAGFTFLTERFDGAVLAFGALSKEEKYNLSLALEFALSETIREGGFSVTPTDYVKLCQIIERAAGNLLDALLIGPDDIAKATDERVHFATALGPLRSAYEASFVERRLAAGFKPAGFYSTGQMGQMNFEPAAQAIPLERLAVAIADLATGARNTAALQRAQKQQGRSRHAGGGKGRLLQRAFNIYHQTRQAHPDSGPQIEWGNDLAKFIKEVLLVAGYSEKEATNKKAIGAAFRRWRERKSSIS